MKLCLCTILNIAQWEPIENPNKTLISKDNRPLGDRSMTLKLREQTFPQLMSIHAILVAFKLQFAQVLTK